MVDAISFVGLLEELGAVRLDVRRSDGVLAVVVMGLPDGRRLLAIERTYREGVKIILEPSEVEVGVAAEGDLWELWNSDRGASLDGLAGDWTPFSAPEGS